MRVRRFVGEFRSFAVKGNMIDMIVGVIIGGAFTAFVSSIVANIATPLIGILIGVDFRAWEIELPRLYGNAEPSKLGIGLFINSIISFLIITLTVFLFVKTYNRFRNKNEKEPDAPPELSKEVELLTEIRDLLKTSQMSGDAENGK